jgi:hypothetical protein
MKVVTRIELAAALLAAACDPPTSAGKKRPRVMVLSYSR